MAYYVALAHLWNLLAGYAGLASVGQQAFVGLGGYALFYLTGVWNVNVYVALLLAGPFAGLTITANILMSLAIDRLGWFVMPPHELSVGRIVGALLMVGGIVLIARF